MGVTFIYASDNLDHHPNFYGLKAVTQYAVPYQMFKALPVVIFNAIISSAVARL